MIFVIFLQLSLQFLLSLLLFTQNPFSFMFRSFSSLPSVYTFFLLVYFASCSYDVCCCDSGGSGRFPTTVEPACMTFFFIFILEEFSKEFELEDKVDVSVTLQTLKKRYDPASW